MSDELVDWLKRVSKRTGIPVGRLIREEMDRLRRGLKSKAFLELAGEIEGPADLSVRKGFSRK
jgi:hypothetical protein